MMWIRDAAVAVIENDYRSGDGEKDDRSVDTQNGGGQNGTVIGNAFDKPSPFTAVVPEAFLTARVLPKLTIYRDAYEAHMLHHFKR
jgi:hypothetical protein